MMMETILEEPDTVDTVDNLILQAKSLYYRRRFDQVISLCNKIWEIDREEPLAWYFKGNSKVLKGILKELNEFTNAIKSFEMALAIISVISFILGVKQIHKRNQ